MAWPKVRERERKEGSLSDIERHGRVCDSNEESNFESADG